MNKLLNTAFNVHGKFSLVSSFSVASASLRLRPATGDFNEFLSFSGCRDFSNYHLEFAASRQLAAFRLITFPEELSRRTFNESLRIFK